MNVHPRIAFEPLAKAGDNRLTEGSSLFDLLAIELKFRILKELDLPDLARLGFTNIYWNNFITDPKIWLPIALRINCIVTNETPVYQQVVTFMDDLLKRGGKIIKVIKGPTIAQFQNLQQWLKARDRVMLWRELASYAMYQFHIPLDKPKKPHECSISETLEKAEKFSAWFFTHRHQISRMSVFHVAELRLTSLPPEFCQLINLELLCFTNNLLSTLPAEISNFKNITCITLDRNEFQTIPAELFELSKLETIDFTKNRLISLSTKIAQWTNLRTFICSHNKLSSVPVELCSLTNLQTLGLDHNELKVLPAEMRRLDKLRRLSLNDNPFDSEFIGSLPDEVSSCLMLKSLEGDTLKLFLNQK